MKHVQNKSKERTLQPFKKKKKLLFAALWMDLENIILNELGHRMTNII